MTSSKLELPQGTGHTGARVQKRPLHGESRRAPAEHHLPPTTEDAELLGRLNAALAASAYSDVRRLTVTCHEGLVLLHGTVSSWYLKQMAQVAVLPVKGTMELKLDQVRVVYPPARDDSFDPLEA